MALYVQKYGGTSVGTLERIEAVAERVEQTRAQGHDVVVVVSAMSGETNRLLGMAQQLEVAFSAVITALMAASITFVVLLVKRRWLLAEISDYNQGLVHSSAQAQRREAISNTEATA